VTEVNAVKTENRELRSILNSQHEMMNGMNALLFRLLNEQHRPKDEEDMQRHNPVVSVTAVPEQPQETEPVTSVVIVLEEILAGSSASAEPVPSTIEAAVAGEVAVAGEAAVAGEVVTNTSAGEVVTISSGEVTLVVEEVVTGGEEPTILE